MTRQGLLIFGPTRDGKRPGQRRVAGLSLADRAVRTMVRAGVERLVVVLPPGESLRLTPLSRRLAGRIEVVASDATSLPFGDTDTAVLVLLGEYVHHHSSLAGLVAAGLDENMLVVQTSPDGDPGSGPMPVAGLPGRSAADGAADALSTGAFLCAERLLAAPMGPGDGGHVLRCLLTRAGQQPTATRTAPAKLWQRVADRQTARRAKRMLFAQVTKPTSGFISRHLNARISIPISKVLVETGLSPHLITVVFVLTTGLLASYMVTLADSYGYLVLSGFLWQMAAVLDRCDGEVARVKLCESKFGAWFDTVTDNVAYLCAYAGMLVAMRRLHPGSPLYTQLGLSAIGALLLTLGVLYAYAVRSGSGSLQHYLRDLAKGLPDSDKGWVQRLMQRYGFAAKRDFFSFFIFLATLANSLEAAYWFIVTMLHLAAGAVLLSQTRMLRGAPREARR